jgi:TM2 domain-containing membrane protein YozV
MYCNNCGNEVENDAQCCSNCGKPVNKGRYCSNCGAPNDPSARFCARCGTAANQAQATPGAIPHRSHPVQAAPPPQTAIPKMPPGTATDGKSPKSKTAAVILSVLFGQFGLHRFYAGKKTTAGLQLLLAIIGYMTLFFSIYGYFVLALLGLWILLDFVMILKGKFKDAKGLRII